MHIGNHRLESRNLMNQMKLVQVVCEGGPYDGTHESRLVEGKAFDPPNQFVALVFLGTQGEPGNKLQVIAEHAYDDARVKSELGRTDPYRRDTNHVYEFVSKNDSGIFCLIKLMYVGTA